MKTFIVIANTKWQRGCDCSSACAVKAGNEKSAIKRAMPFFECDYHFRHADSFEIFVEELTPEKCAAIREGYNELTNAERDMRNEHGSQSHSLQWYILDELRIAIIQL